MVSRGETCKAKFTLLQKVMTFFHRELIESGALGYDHLKVMQMVKNLQIWQIEHCMQGAREKDVHVLCLIN